MPYCIPTLVTILAATSWTLLQSVSRHSAATYLPRLPVTLQAVPFTPLSSVLHPLGLDREAPRTSPLPPPHLVWGAVAWPLD